MEKRNLRKERIGVVSSNKGDKTITVTIKWKEKHPIYGKKDLAPNFTNNAGERRPSGGSRRGGGFRKKNNNR